VGDNGMPLTPSYETLPQHTFTNSSLFTTAHTGPNTWLATSWEHTPLACKANCLAAAVHAHTHDSCRRPPLLQLPCRAHGTPCESPHPNMGDWRRMVRHPAVPVPRPQLHQQLAQTCC
jgi:hypothetical protein